MNVLSLLTTALVSEVVASHNAFYARDGKYEISEAIYQRFISNISGKVLIRNAGVIVIDLWQSRHDDPQDDEDTADVSMRYPDKEEPYGIDFMPWGEILACEFENNIPGASLADAAAHVFWEMTWHGDEQDAEVRRDDVLDAVEDVTRAIEEGTTADKFVNVDEFLDDLMSEFSPDERAESDRISANAKTARHFKNGVEWKRTAK